MKVVWLCHFANKEMKDYFGTPAINEFAPWISNLILLFKKRTDIELHIIAPNVFTNHDCNFIKDGINYHFYNHIPIPYYNKYLKKIYVLLRIDDVTNFYWIKHKIKHITNKIKPDLIHLHGAENPYYSAGILPIIDKYPTLTTIQGYIRNASQTNKNIIKRIKIEELILCNSKYIGTRTIEMSKIALQINPNATLHFHNYPLKIPNIIKTNIGKDEPIDCVFFARVCKDKGIEDLLAAIAIIKEIIPKVTLSVIGGTSKSYQSYLLKTCSELKIEKNVKFLGFLPTQADIFHYILQAKICVLPTYHDIIPGTIIESMFIKLPVIAYAVGGIPELNTNDENLILVERFNIIQLSEKIIYLLQNNEIRVELAERAFSFIIQKFNNKEVIPDILSAYHKILHPEIDKNARN